MTELQQKKNRINFYLVLLIQQLLRFFSEVHLAWSIKTQWLLGWGELYWLDILITTHFCSATFVRHPCASHKCQFCHANVVRHSRDMYENSRRNFDLKIFIRAVFVRHTQMPCKYQYSVIPIENCRYFSRTVVSLTSHKLSRFSEIQAERTQSCLHLIQRDIDVPINDCVQVFTTEVTLNH